MARVAILPFTTCLQTVASLVLLSPRREGDCVEVEGDGVEEEGDGVEEEGDGVEEEGDGVEVRRYEAAVKADYFKIIGSLLIFWLSRIETLIF
ncbi:hypothetical protein CHS0354_031598 [Potamilus streckersoni]|uniref:Secreted protein n=1 Tax=Potamilus streckersoni TaxID=2493646 RepID=A0AAE0SHG2_9BIVA|nr:hypothetical protein CHS0354_031598 [Potamilus streckersoni]